MLLEVVWREAGFDMEGDRSELAYRMVVERCRDLEMSSEEVNPNEEES